MPKQLLVGIVKLILLSIGLINDNSAVALSRFSSSTQRISISHPQKIIPPKTFLKPNIQKPLKLPVWPVVGGVVAQLIDWTGNEMLAERLTELIGGRVIPISLTDSNVSPFLLLVHHRHSFTPFDPFRALTSLLLPEGFPAHPHAGFDTLTYCIKGGLKHRDSEGISMKYGDGSAQWMRAGRGVIHEEMWDIPTNEYKEIEIFQLWLNLPSKLKNSPPFVKLLNTDQIINITNINLGVKARILCGDIQVIDNDNTSSIVGDDVAGNAVAGSPLAILDLNLRSNKSIALSFAANCSCVLYVRKGSLKIDKDTAELRYGHICTYEKSTVFSSNDESAESSISVSAGDEGLDVLILVAEPLQEPVVMSGPFVMNSEEAYLSKAKAFNYMGRNGFWDYRISNEEWQQHIKALNLQKLLDQFT
jgi:redox-sensitive bicupin YhaK (pirin superfamily)